MGVGNRQTVTFIGQRSYIPKYDYMMTSWPTECVDDYTLHTDFTVELTESFRPERITQCLFGDDSLKCQQTIVISGNQTDNRMKNRIFFKKHFKECKPCHENFLNKKPFSVDWLSSYFGLPDDFKSFVHFRPRVNEYIFTPHARWNLDPLLDGLYIEFYTPLVYTKWDLNFKERVEQRGTQGYEAGYMAPTAIDRDHLCPNFTSFITGCCHVQDENVLFQPLKFAKMHTCGGLRTVKLTEIATYVGWDFKRTEHYRLGTSLFCSAPAGTRPDGIYLFQPIAGNGHHWYAGAHLYGSMHVAQDEDNDAYCTLHADMALSHLFGTDQKRSFDVKGKPNSRYMLVEKITPPVDDMLEGNGIPPISQFKQELAPLANFSTLDVNVSIGAQFNINAFFSYTKRDCSWLFGYRYWTRSCDNITLCNPQQFPSGQWALKGDAYLYGFVAEDGTLPLQTPVALSATQSAATIHGGTNIPIKRSLNPALLAAARRNPGIDSPQPATAGSNQILAASPDDLTTANQTHTSIQPHTIHLCDLNLDSARTTGTVQTIVTSVVRTWEQNEYMTMSLGLGADIDFGKNSDPTPPAEFNECINCAFSAWKLYGHFSIAFG